MSPAIEHLTLSDGYRAAVRWWRPPNPRGVVLYFHGIQSHGGWYEQSGAALAERGFTVLMPDRRGSGLNTVDRGDVRDADTWLTDVEDQIAELVALAGDRLVVHLIGVSWGGKLICAAATRGFHGTLVASLTLVAPGVFPRVDLPAFEKFKVAWSLMADPTQHYPIPLDDARMFTANLQRMEYVERDPHRLRTVTARFLLESRRLDRLARRLATSAWRGRVHLVLAGQERIIDLVRTREWFGQFPAGRGKITEYPAAYHTLEFEPDPAPFRKSVRDFLNEGCPA